MQNTPVSPLTDAAENETRKTRRRVLPLLLGAAAAGLATAAVVGELRRPPEARTWHGRVAGVPYDFRPPTLARARDRIWNPDEPILVGTIFGLGWTVNWCRLLLVLGALRDRLRRPR